MWRNLKSNPPVTTKKQASKRASGDAAEAMTCTYLKQQGLKLKEKNINYHRCGEIDLIMLDGQQLVFVEVRFRKSNAFGGALASVNSTKQHKLQKAAQRYLQETFGNRPPSCRFDVVGVSQSDSTFHFDWIKNAFC